MNKAASVKENEDFIRELISINNKEKEEIIIWLHIKKYKEEQEFSIVFKKVDVTSAYNLNNPSMRQEINKQITKLNGIGCEYKRVWILSEVIENE